MKQGSKYCLQYLMIVSDCVGQEKKVVILSIVRISPKWYRRIGLLVPRGAEAWYRSYRSDGTGTKVPIYTLSKGAVRTVPQGTPR